MHTDDLKELIIELKTKLGEANNDPTPLTIQSALLDEIIQALEDKQIPSVSQDSYKHKLIHEIGCCPVCNSPGENDLYEQGVPNGHSDVLYTFLGCKHCGSWWEDRYKFVEYRVTKWGTQS